MRRVERKRQRRRLAKGRSGRFGKYVYLLLCVTCISVSWTSARHVSEIEGVVDSGRVAKFSYEITAKAYVDGVEVSNPVENGTLSLDLSAAEKREVELVYQITYDSEVALQFYVQRQYTGDGANLYKEMDYVDQITSVTYAAVAGEVFKEQNFETKRPVPESRYILISPSKGTIKCQVTLLHDPTINEIHSLKLVPTVVQVD